jgi:hypothetical protein
VRRIRGSHTLDDAAYLASYQGVHYWDGSGWQQFHPSSLGSGKYGQDAICIERSGSSLSKLALGAGQSNQARMYLCESSGFSDRTGNLETLMSPIKTTFSDIDVVMLPDYVGGCL